jgi:hypothetical protein
MSYDISVFEWPQGFGQPADIEQINLVMEGLSAEPADNGKFKALAKALVDRFPYSGFSRRDPRSDGATDWPGDPVADAETLDAAVWRFALPSENRELILQFIADQARSLGLAVFDDQIPVAFLPSGLILPKEAEEAWGEVLQFLPQLQAAQPRLTKAQVRKMALPRLKEMLIRRGFEVGKPDEASVRLRGEFKASRSNLRGVQEVLCGQFDAYHEAFRFSVVFLA